MGLVLKQQMKSLKLHQKKFLLKFFSWQFFQSILAGENIARRLLKKILTCFLKSFLLSFIKIIESPYETEKPKPRSPPADKKNTVSTFECGLIITLSFLARVCQAYLMAHLMTLSISSHQSCSVQKGALRNITKFAGKHLCWSLFFDKVAGRQTLLKKRLWHRRFPVNFVEFLGTPFLQNTSGRLLLSI